MASSMRPSLGLLAAAMLAGAPNDIVRANGSRDPADGVVRVFLLAGQSNMEGHGVVDLDDERDYNGGRGNLVEFIASD